MDLQEAFDAGFEAVKRYVDEGFTAFENRIKALEARQPLQGAPGPAGKDGPNEEVISAMVARAVAALPPAPSGPAGEPGAAGKDGRDAPSLAEVKALVTDAVAALPPAPAGEPGRNGKDADVEAITANVMERVTEAMKAIPAPKDGRDGKDGEPGPAGLQGERGEKGIAGEAGPAGLPGERGVPGADGKDGVGLAGSVIDRAGELVVTMTDGSQRQLGPVVGKDGAPGQAGKDGADALGFDDLSIEFDGERAFTFALVRGETRKEFGPFTLPVMVYRGVFKDGMEAKQGDAVTWGGSLWIATRDTSDKPETSDAWRLAVKRGRDGKDGVMKAASEPKPVSLAR